MRTLDLRRLPNHIGEVMRALDAGQSFTLTRNGVPIAEVRPTKRRYFVPKAVVLRAFRGAPSIALGRLCADLDAITRQDPTPYK